MGGQGGAASASAAPHDAEAGHDEDEEDAADDDADFGVEAEAAGDGVVGGVVCRCRRRDVDGCLGEKRALD